MNGFSKSWRVIMACVMAVCMAALAGCGASKSASGGGSGGAAKGGKVELKLAYHLPVDHHLSKSIEKFAKTVTELKARLLPQDSSHCHQLQERGHQAR